MHPMLNIALRAARDAGDALALNCARRDSVELEPSESGELFSKQDRDALTTLVYHIEKSFPNHGIRSRLHDKPADQQLQTVWHLDSMLAPFNFLHGHPCFGISLAAEVKGRIDHAVLVFPMLGEEYTGSRGAGAQLNERRIRVQPGALEKNQLFGHHSDSAPLPDALARFASDSGLRLRDSGCAEHDLCLAASGRLAAGFHGRDRSAGLRAAELVFSEAGGLLGDASGGPRKEASSGCLYAGPKIFKSLVKACA